MLFCSISSFFCCKSTDPNIDFRHSTIEISGELVWTDIFVQVDRTTILENDYLNVIRAGETITSELKQYT